MTPFSFPTGRTYNGPQVLEISVVSSTPLSEGDPWVNTVFLVKDASRRMEIKIETITTGCETKNEIGRLALSMYDHGKYTEA